MPGRKYEARSGYRYGFNGKENDNEVKGEGNEQDYGMRIYDPRLGRFLSVDPISKHYPELTTYQFASNSPISGIDLDGLEYYFTADGKFLGHRTTDAKGNLLDEKTANSVRLASRATTTKDYTVYENPRDLNIGIKAFNRLAGAAYAESRTENHDEVFAFANAMINNANNSKRSYDQIARLTDNNGPSVSNAITDGNEKFKKYMNTPYSKNTDEMNQAQAGVINALAGGKDYSNGADHWDGSDASTGTSSSQKITSFYTHRAHGEFKGVFDPSNGIIMCQFWDNVATYAAKHNNTWILKNIKDFPLYNNFSEKDKKKYYPYMTITTTIGISIFYKSNDYYDNKKTPKYRPKKP